MVGLAWTRVRDDYEDADQEAEFQIVHLHYGGTLETFILWILDRVDKETLRAAAGAKQGTLNFAILIIKSHFLRI
jgi:hypothetical protein